MDFVKIFNQELGYRNVERQERMDVDHALVTLNSLGRLHAMSVILLHAGQLDNTKLRVYSMARNEPITNALLKMGLTTMSAVMRKSWGTQWATTADKLERMAEDAGERLNRLCTEETGRMIVFNHGDCWINNIMFKYAPWTSIPIGIRFVDFQESHFNTFGWDLTYFFHLSMSMSEVYSKYDLLLEAYRNSLLDTFRLYEFEAQNVPTIDDMKQELDRLLVYGLFIATVTLPILMARGDADLKVEEILDDSESSVAKKMVLFSDEKFTRLIKVFLERCIRLGKL